MGDTEGSTKDAAGIGERVKRTAVDVVNAIERREDVGDKRGDDDDDDESSGGHQWGVAAGGRRPRHLRGKRIPCRQRPPPPGRRRHGTSTPHP